MNPYPLAPLNHFTVPFSLTKNSFRLCSDLTFAPSVELVLLYNPLRGKTKAPPLNITPTKKAPSVRRWRKPQPNFGEPFYRRDFVTTGHETSTPSEHSPCP